MDKLSKKFDYTKNGNKAVILFHAYTGTPNDVLSIGRALARKNYTVMTPTFDGHGTDDPNEILEYGIKDWIKNGEDAYQTLVDDGFTDISVFGLSLGGVVATHVMLNKDVKSYGVFSSPVISSTDSKVPENFWIWYKFKMKQIGVDQEEVNKKESEVMDQLGTVLTGINDQTTEMSKEYASVNLPVFIAQGGADEMIRADQAYEYRDALESAEVDFHWYEDAPHVITTGRIGKELQTDLIAFLEQNA